MQGHLERGLQDRSNPAICVPCSVRSERDEENKLEIQTPNMSRSAPKPQAMPRPMKDKNKKTIRDQFECLLLLVHSKATLTLMASLITNM